MTQPEAKIKRQIKDFVKASGGYYAPIPEGSFGKRGDSDMIICYRGRFIAMEGKTYTGSQSGWQETRQIQVEAAGGIYIIGRTVAHVRDVFERIDKEIDGDGSVQKENKG